MIKKNRKALIVCVVLMASVGGLNFVDFILEAWKGGISGELIRPLGLAIMFGGLAISSYYKELATSD